MSFASLPLLAFPTLGGLAEVAEVTETFASLAIMKEVLRVMPEPCDLMQFVNCFLAVNSSSLFRPLLTPLQRGELLTAEVFVSLRLLPSGGKAGKGLLERSGEAYIIG